MGETANPGAAAAPVSASGLMLSAARHAQGLQIADVARQLKLSPAQVEALEAGDFGKLPGPVFVRGFIRNYARLLKLDPDAVWSALEPEMPRGPQQGQVPPSRDIPLPSVQARSSRWPRYAVFAVLLAGGLAAYEFRADDIAVTEAPPVAAQPAPEAPRQEAAAAPGGDVAQPAAGQADAAQPAVAEGPAAPVAAEALTAQAAVPAAGDAAPAAAHELRLVFEKPSWVEIRDRSERVIFSQLNPAGSEQRVSGTPPFSLVIGNASGVRLSHNDSPVDLARHTRVDVARFTLE